MAYNDYENADKQKEQQKEQQREQQINNSLTFVDIRKNLIGMQQWDLGKNQTVEERRMQEQTRILSNAEGNKSLLTELTKSVTEIDNNLVAASGNPVQEVAPAKVSRKEQRRRNKETRIARETNPLADYRSYRISSHLIEHEEGKIRSISMYEKKANRRGISTDTLKAYCNGYKCNSKNEPLNKTEERKRNEDAHFLETYISGNRTHRNHLLERITIELLNMDLTENDFSEANLLAHHAEVKQKVDKIVHFKDIYEDELNRSYFDSLSQFKKDMIENLIFVKYRFIESMSQQCFLRMKVDSKSGEIVKHKKHNDYNANTESSKLKRSIEVSAANMKVAAEKEVHRLIRSFINGEITTRNPSELTQIKNEYNNKRKKRVDSLTNKYRDTIAKNKAIYSQKSDLMNTLYQKKYHGAEILFDVSQQLSALYDISLGYDDEKKNLETSYICEAIDEVKKKLNQTKELLEKEDKNLDNILNHLLKGEKLSDDAKSYMEDIEFEIETKDLSPEERQITREVQKINKNADYRTVRAVNSLKELDIAMRNITDSYLEDMKAKNIDNRMMRAFCTGYKSDKDGNPIDEKEEKKKKKDDEFLKDYIYGDSQKRKPHLQRILKELLSINFEEIDFSAEYILKNPIEMITLSSRLTYIDNLMNANTDFFDGLSNEDKDRLYIMNKLSGLQFYIGFHAQTVGISFNHMGFYEEEEEEGALESRINDYSLEINKALTELENEKNIKIKLKGIDPPL